MLINSNIWHQKSKEIKNTTKVDIYSLGVILEILFDLKIIG
jgi:hypothetical protein